MTSRPGKGFPGLFLMKQFWLFAWAGMDGLRTGNLGGMKDFVRSFSTTHEAVKFVVNLKPNSKKGGRYCWHVVDSKDGHTSAKSL